MFPFLILAACLPDGDDDDTGHFATCEDIEDDFRAEAEAIRSCTEDAECGQVLTGTSCGCTRNWVARLDADTERFYALIDAAGDASCDLGLMSTCDCPEVDGYDCAGGTCTWDYSIGAYPDCRAADGDPYDIEGASIAEDRLLVTVSAGGGCEDHDWTLCWPDGSFAESEPVQARMEIQHDDHDDPCDAIITEDLDFDLVPLKEAWMAAYGGSSGTIIVVLGEERLEYSF